MSPTRLVMRGALLAPGRILVPSPVARHAWVARVAPDEPVELLDLDGSVATGRVVGWQGRECIVDVAEVARDRGEPPAPLILALGVLHTDAFTWAVEKATEMGATTVLPVLCARVQGRKHASRVARWQRVADAAVAQCGRSRAPTVAEPAALTDVLEIPMGERLVSRRGAPLVGGLTRAGSGILVLVGPEGGLTEEENAAAERAGFTGLPLGPRTLRAETAAVAALTAVQLLAGW